jgi:hypothetical protein
MCPEDTCKHFILWQRDMFSFTTHATTTLYDVQMLKDKDTLAELDDNIIDNICRAIRLESAVTEVASTRLKCYPS